MTERIVVPTDFSDASRAGVVMAGELAARLGATLTLVHVWDPDPIASPPPMLGWSIEQQQALVLEITESIQTRLDELAASMPEGVQVTTQVLEGTSPARAIAKYAAAEPPDLIVIATHGRTGLQRFLLGSVTEQLVRLASCPVLTVPSPVQKG